MLIESMYRHAVLPMFESVYKRRKTLQYWKQLEQSQWQSPEEVERVQLDALRELLQHAAENCPYYREQWQSAGLDVRQLEDRAAFARWPLLEKQQIREHRKRLRAVRYPRPLISKSTGGSTGEPLHFDLDGRSHQRRCAATFRGYNWAGAGPGTKQFYLWGVPLDTPTV